MEGPFGGPPIVAPQILGGPQYFWISIIVHSMIHLRFVVWKYIPVVIEEKKEKKKRTNSIQGGINEYDHDKFRKYSMFKKHKLFFINIGSHRDTPN